MTLSSSPSPTQPINIRRSTDSRSSIDESEKPALTQDTLRALNEFLSEAKAAADEQQNPFSENWGLSQASISVLAVMHYAPIYMHVPLGTEPSAV